MDDLGIRTRPAHDLEVPEIFGRLREIVYDLWWSWSPKAHLLFNRVAPSTWHIFRNPIEALIDVGPDQWNALADDADFTRTYHELVSEYDAYHRPPRPPWFERRQRPAGPYAYFSMEFAWHECLRIYSGGLGVLAGDHCKSASDLGLPLIGVGLMYRHGYFSQTIDADGRQQHSYPDYDLHRLPLRPVVDRHDRELHIPVDFPGRTVYVRVWKAQIGRVQVLLLDSDLPINHPSDRPITSMLYVRGREMRLCQEIILGIGGATLLETLGVRPTVWHMNEGHSALLVLQRMAEAIRRGAAGIDETLAELRASSVFTTHTPVAAGNEQFDRGTVGKYLEPWCSSRSVDFERVLELGRGAGEDGDALNLTALAMRTSGRSNAVSRKHGEVANAMWKPLLEADGLPQIESITNGIHVASWIGPEVGTLLDRYGAAPSDGLLADDFAEAVARIPDYELWTAHLQQKRRLIALVRERTQRQYARHGRSPDELRDVEDLLDPDVLTIGFARRFATYKRADLLLADENRLRALVRHAERPIQLVFAGKAHPADQPGQELVRRIFTMGLTSEMRGRVVFLENYDMRIGRHLVQGVDLWLNTPRRPLEASGTSGMKAAVNGVLNCSILDGWWCEGMGDGLGWAIEPQIDRDQVDEATQDRADAEELYRVLEQEVAPVYYARSGQGMPTDWIAHMRRSIIELTPTFSSSRMVREYADRFYQPQGRAVG